MVVQGSGVQGSKVIDWNLECLWLAKNHFFPLLFEAGKHCIKIDLVQRTCEP
jgi:hypothetical protein